MSDSDSTLSPAEELAQRVANGLVEQGLLSESYGPKVVAQIISGKMRPEDWKLVFETTLDLESQNRGGDDAAIS